MILDLAAPETVFFGIDAFWFAVALFVGTYLIIMTEKINRAIIALLGAGIMVISGLMSQDHAIAAIDFNTLGLLAGMMVIVHITGKTGLFEYVAIWSVKKVRARPWATMVMLSILTAVFSALLDNVTTVLLVTPVLLNICRRLDVPIYPYLFVTIFASNIGGTATLIGDPPNILIGSAANIPFNDFIINLGPVVVVIFLATLLPIYLMWGRKLHATDEKRAEVMKLDAKSSITDRRLMMDCLFVCALVIGGFAMHHALGLQPATIAMTGAALLLMLENTRHDRAHHAKNVHAAFAEAEWVTLFFFIGLFILVHGIERVGLIGLMGEKLVAVTAGDQATMGYAILWGSAFISAFMDNIPFTATMIPMIQSVGADFGGDQGLTPLWWSLSLGACLGGNGTLIGASANLVVAGMAERNGQPIRFLTYMKHALPLMILSILISHLYLYLRYFS